MDSGSACTVMRRDADLPLKLAQRMVALPAATGVIAPLASTVATAGSLLLQEMAEADLSLSFARAVRRSPGQSSACVGCTEIELGARSTLTFSVALWPNSLVTVMVALFPARTPCTAPSFAFT